MRGPSEAQSDEKVNGTAWHQLGEPNVRTGKKAYQTSKHDEDPCIELGQSLWCATKGPIVGYRRQ